MQGPHDRPKQSPVRFIRVGTAPSSLRLLRSPPFGRDFGHDSEPSCSEAGSGWPLNHFLAEGKTKCNIFFLPSCPSTPVSRYVPSRNPLSSKKPKTGPGRPGPVKKQLFVPQDDAARDPHSRVSTEVVDEPQPRVFHLPGTCLALQLLIDLVHHPEPGRP